MVASHSSIFASLGLANASLHEMMESGVKGSCIKKKKNGCEAYYMPVVEASGKTYNRAGGMC